MISIETWYKTHDGKLLAIIEVFKTWRYYLEGCKYKILIHKLQHPPSFYEYKELELQIGLLGPRALLIQFLNLLLLK